MELEEQELAILEDENFLPMKAKVCLKVEGLLAELHTDLIELMSGYEPTEWPKIRQSKGKISRGENYHHYAYRVLDYPNVLTKDDMFLFRSMMLWGDAYSFHFILAGKYLEAFQDKLIGALYKLPKETLLATHDDPWIWHSSAPNWKGLGDLGTKGLKDEMKKRKFMKLSHFLNLKEYSQARERSREILERYLDILFLIP